MFLKHDNFFIKKRRHEILLTQFGSQVLLTFNKVTNFTQCTQEQTSHTIIKVIKKQSTIYKGNKLKFL